MMKWVKTKFLGEGSYGTVSLAKPLVVPPGFPNPSPVIAVKFAEYVDSSSLVDEGMLMHSLGGSPYVLRCFGEDYSRENDKYVYNLLLEYAPGGNLSDLINSQAGSGSTISESEVSVYAYMLLMGLRHIHGKGVVHCDLKPDNILVFPSKENGIVVNRLKIADFGLAKKAGIAGSFSRCGRIYKYRGTPAYTSPESVLMGQNEPPLDIWSLGCILIEIFSGKTAYSLSQSLMSLLGEIASEEELPEIPNKLSEKATDFLTKCLIRDPQRRWTADMLLRHPFIIDNCKRLSREEISQIILWEDEPMSYDPSLWISTESSFTTPTPIPTPTPTHVPLLPHQMFSRNNAVVAGLGN